MHRGGAMDGDRDKGNALRRLHLLVGLGNPGTKYAATRHNIGFMVVERVAAEFGIGLDREKFKTAFGRGRVEARDVILAKPLAFMNRSGLPLRQLADFFHISSGDMVIVHDDIDLAFGRIQIKEKGGHGGHNGIRSVIDAFGGGDFPRLRVGIGRSVNGGSVADYVLDRFDAEEVRLLPRIISRARDAVVTVLCQGTGVGMNQFNNRTIILTD